VCDPGGPCKIAIQSLVISTWMRYEEIPLAPAFVHHFCPSGFAPRFVQAVIPGLSWPRYLVLALGGEMQVPAAQPQPASRERLLR